MSYVTGTHALKVTLNRCLVTQGLEASVTGQYNPAKNIVQSVTRPWTDSNGNVVADCDLRNPQARNLTVTRGDIRGAMSNQLFGQAVATAAVDPDLIQGWATRDFNWEFSTGVQHELTPRLRFGKVLKIARMRAALNLDV